MRLEENRVVLPDGYPEPSSLRAGLGFLLLSHLCFSWAMMSQNLSLKKLLHFIRLALTSNMQSTRAPQRHRDALQGFDTIRYDTKI
jgi:hypothetical protein